MQTKQKKWWQRSLAMMLSLVLIVCSVVMVGVPEKVKAAGVDVYVASNGDDANGDGTSGNPYATLNKAYSAIPVNGEGTIYIMDDIEINNENVKYATFTANKTVTITSVSSTPVVIQRTGNHSTGSLDVIVNVKGGTLILKNIIFDGGAQRSSAPASRGRLFNVEGINAKLIIDDGTTLRNNITGNAIYMFAGTMEMIGGEISNNNKENVSAMSSAIYLSNVNSKFKMTGGKITDNAGSGVYVANGSVHISGNANITGNTLVGAERNVYLDSTKLLTLDGDFTGKAGITAQNRMTVGSQFGQATEAGLKGLGNLHADNNDPNLFVAYDGANGLIWGSLDLISPTGTVTTGKPTFTGTAVPGSQVTVKVGGITLTATADVDGNWSVTPGTDIPDGVYAVEVTASKGATQFGPVTEEITVKTTIVDKTALGNKITEVEGLTEKDYTPDSWTALQNELTKAKAIFDNPNATQTEVNEALINLTKAKDNLVLVKPKEKTAVLEQTAGANKVAVTFDKNIQVTDLAGFAITVDGTEVTPTGFEVIGDKLVLTFPNNPDVTDKAVKVKYDGTGNLQGTNGAAIEQFELPVEDPYSAAFQITKPDAVTANPQPTIGGKVDVTTTPSTVTIVLKNDKDEPVLVDVVAIVDPVTGDWTFTPPTDLPDGTYTIIATATNGQQTVTKKHTFKVATTPIVNKVPLQQKVEEAKNLVAGEYTPASWAQYQEALKKANEVLTNPNATQEEVDKALAALTGAQNALVKIGKGLGTLTPSTGTLSPSFQTGVTDYTMTVGYSTSVIDFTAIPVEAGATVTTTVNGQPGSIGQIPLQVGENIIVITVKDANGNVRQYTIKVYREAYTGGGSWTPNPTPPVTPTPGDTKTKIQVELEIDGEKPLAKTTVEIERTKQHANGDITDFVALTEANAKEAVAKAKEIGNNIARIVLPDVNDEVKEAKVEIPKESLKLLRDNGLSLEISSENGHIAIPVSSMEGIDDNFYFRLVPVKKESERQAIEERARAERVVRETLQSNDVHVVARPMTIETNMPSRPVQVTLPLKGVKIPTNTAEREAFLKQLAVFIEHSDGEKKVVIPEVVTMAKGELGLRFTVEKFSTFTIIQVNKKEETKPPLEVKEHEAYIKGFQDGTFGPEKNVTRAQVATMIARILGYTDGPVNTAPFKDIPSDHYAAGAIAFVKERGIMNGDVNGNFRASENITRAQMATVVANFKQLSIEENVAITFNDTKGHWAQWIIEANRAAGIINGRQDDSFAPDEHLTRAQAVIMMNRMFERGPLQGVTAPSFPDVKATHWAFKEIEEAAKSHVYFIDEDEKEQLSK
ncbi:S-layer homology domain-containing protein [Lysinibacillus pakistanensis]|uniref:S-layer homology domain-containing protein n=1 Tax=Lysinibacillus pakistanensis TaxID=759811 RepID=UPI003D2B634E